MLEFAAERLLELATFLDHFERSEEIEAWWGQKDVIWDLIDFARLYTYK